MCSLHDDLVVKHTTAHQLLTNQELQRNSQRGGDRRTGEKGRKEEKKSNGEKNRKRRRSETGMTIWT